MFRISEKSTHRGSLHSERSSAGTYKTTLGSRQETTEGHSVNTGKQEVARTNATHFLEKNKCHSLPGTFLL